MEKAKLIVKLTKKKKVAAEVEFEAGKKMPVPQLKLTDTTLDGTEVEVERQEGRIVLIKADDEVLFSAPQPTDHPASKPNPEKLLKTSDRSKHSAGSSQDPAISKPDRQNEHVSHVRNPAYAPYNFIPLNHKVVEINPPIPSMNKYHPERNTGWIELEIETITPVYIRGTLTKDEIEEGRESKNKPDFCAPVGKIRIPGSSLRGMVRNMVEIISFGKFHFFEDRQLYYRGLADRSNLREEYQSRMSSYDRQARRTQYNFSVGLLRKSNKKEPGLHFEIKSSGSNFRQILKSEAREMVHAIGEKYAPFRFYKVKQEYLVVSGDMPNKKRDWLIHEPSESAEITDIPPKDVQNYNEDRTRDKEDRTRDKGVPNLLKCARQKENEEGVPCFYVLWKDAKGKDRVSFGHTGMFRLAYEKTIGEHVTTVSHSIDEEALEDLENGISKVSFEKVQLLKGREFSQSELANVLDGEDLQKSEIKKVLQASAKIDFAEAIFGNEYKHSGRVFFEDAFLVDDQDDPHLETQTPQILSTPKPTTFQHYLVQNSDEVKQLNHYNSNTALRGYKLYWHKSGERWIESERTAKDTQYTEIRPVKAGTKFRGRIRFENLSDKELGALLYALDLPEGCGHKLGIGKPLGLGSVRVTPTLYLSNRSQRYRNFFAEWDNKIAPSDLATLQNLKRDFERYVLQEIGEDSGKLLWETNRLRELLVMLLYDERKELEQTGANHYMVIAPRNEFKNRYVLPKASHVAPASKVEVVLEQLRNERRPQFKNEADAKPEIIAQEPDEPEAANEIITHIKKVEITGLWDKFNINWLVDEKVNILVGINGSGKTTLLELIRHALADEYENPEKVKYPPQEFSIIFDNDEKLSYQRTQRGTKSGAKLRSRLIPEFVSTFDAPLELEGTQKDQKETTAGQIEKQLASRLGERVDRFFQELDDVADIDVDPTPHIDDFVQLVEEVFGRTQKKIEFVGEIKFTRAWLNQFCLKNEVSSELRESLEAMVSDETYKLDEKFPEFLESKIGRANASRLRSKILQHAEFLQDSPPSQAIFHLSDGRILMPDQLSTGEKQMLIILFTALILKLRSLISEEQHYILIMDEPENSLHLKWQKFLISYVRRLNESVQIVIATHAPAIIKKGYMEKTIEMNHIKSPMEA